METTLSDSKSSHFDKRLVSKCHDRLKKTKDAFYLCRHSSTIDEFRSHWSSFLIAAGSVIHAVEAGANHTPQGKQWYGGIRRLSRADPLVSYMYQARNSEEHDSEEVTANSYGLPLGFKDHDSDDIEWLSDQYKYSPERKRTMVIGNAPTGPTLRPVKDQRYRMVFKPPREHKGKPLADDGPIAVGKLYIAYLEDLVRKAEAIS